MKKIFTFFIVSCLFSMTFAQQFPDGSFENGWENFEAIDGNYLDYSSAILYSLNELYEEPEVGVLTTYRETSAYSGSYALKLESKNPTICFIPGAIGTIKEDFVQEFLDNGGLDLWRNFNFTERPLGIQGYYKYQPVSGDSAAIEFEVRQGSTLLASAIFIEKNWVDEWTPFYVALNYLEDTVTIPTALKLIFAASAGYNFANLQQCKGQEGSLLFIDNVSFVYENTPIETAIREQTATPVVVAPNPTNNVTTFHFGQNVRGELTIYNIVGAKVLTQQVCGETATVNLSNVEVGAYFYVLTCDGNVQNRGKLQVVR